MKSLNKPRKKIEQDAPVYPHGILPGKRELAQSALFKNCPAAENDKMWSGQQDQIVILENHHEG